MDETTIINSSPNTNVGKYYKPISTNLQNSPLGQASTPKTRTKNLILKKEKGTIEDRQLAAKSRLLNDELTRQIAIYRKSNFQLQQATKILNEYEKEIKVLKLIQKWRAVAQAGMSFLLNSTLLKISKLGGYEKLVRKELEAKKRKIEYQVDDTMQDQMDEVLESEDFQILPEEDQQEYKDCMADKIQEAQSWKEKEFTRLEEEFRNCADQEMTMEELSKRLKVEYALVFPNE